jgi:ABC-type glycerol-3-phosphate transport system substrate-binding protein
MNIRPFQIILLAAFGILAVLSLIFFSLYQGSGSREAKTYGDRVVIWGTLDQTAFLSAFREISREEKDFQVVTYVEKDPRTFDYELVDALARGDAPNLIVLPSSSLAFHRDKLLVLSYETVPERTFRDRYVDGAEIYLSDEGVYGIPFAVDPIVMYWNRDLFSASGIATPPRTWASLRDRTVPTLTQISQTRDVTQSGVALGEYANIRNAKEILATLFLQAGTEIVSRDGTTYDVSLRRGAESSASPADAALAYYTRFALPSSPQYSWSRSLPEDRLFFSGGTLGIYFGFGSEYGAIQAANPNLNFDIAPVPQDAGATTLRTYGTFYAFAIPRAASNQTGAFRAAEVLAGAGASEIITAALRVAPARRDLVATRGGNAYEEALRTAGLVARGWFDPNPDASETVFRQMVEDVTSGRSRVNEATNDAAKRLEQLFR